MKFRSGDLEFNATVADGNQSTSPQTGNPLRSLTIQFRAQKLAMHQQALVEAELRRAGGVFSLTDAGEPELEWRIRESSSTYIGTEPYGINHHAWLLDQVERLKCERLIIGSVELEPYEYLEQASETGAVRLAARAHVAEADLDGLSRVSGVITVLRVGVSEDARNMHVEGYVWGDSPSSSDGLGVAIVCADAREPRVTLAGVQGVPPADALDDLLGALETKGVFDAAERAALDERIRQRRHAIRRVANIDAWDL